MRFLLDTHTLIWALFDPDKLPVEIQLTISNLRNEIYVSTASLWEIEIKNQKRPLTMPYNSKLIELSISNAGYYILPIDSQDINNIDFIMQQNIHNDPFDHILLSTAKSRDLCLITHDKTISKYKDVQMKIY